MVSLASKIVICSFLVMVFVVGFVWMVLFRMMSTWYITGIVDKNSTDWGLCLMSFRRVAFYSTRVSNVNL